MLPFEFTINGTPVSLQARNRTRLRAWKTAVANAASTATNGAIPTIDDVAIEITYYYVGDTPDVDNIIKPIQDALIGIVYKDDDQVVDTRSRKSRLDGSFKIVGASAVLLVAFALGTAFLHIKVTEPGDHTDLTL